MAQRQWRSDDTDKWLYAFGNGTDGAYAPTTGTDAPIDSACTGTSGATSLTATNAGFAAGQLILIHQTIGTGQGNWELNRIASYTAGTITTSHALINTYGSGAQVLVLKQYYSALIDTGVTLTTKAWNGTVGGVTGWFCKGLTTITGTLTCDGKSFAGGIADGSSGGWNGTESAASTKTTSANGKSGGGGSDNNNAESGGGGGGHSAAGENGEAPGGAGAGGGGGTGGTASLVTMMFGGSGGSGSSRPEAPYQGVHAGDGGAGAGIICIFSKLLTVTGSLSNKGVKGQDSPGTQLSAGGGGAGGSILLKAKSVTLGSSLVDASGGARGAGGSSAGYGGAGSAGRIHLDYSASLSGSTTPTLDSTFDTTIREKLAPIQFFT